MMKVAILLVACLAVASAFESQVLSYCSITVSSTCAAANATCYTSTLGASIYCPAGTYRSSTGTSCYCKAVTKLAPTIGDLCTAGDVSGNGLVCTKKNPTNGDDNYYYFSIKTQGDTCSSSFDCLPPRQCSSGKCYNQLLTGDVCYNYTGSIFTLTGSCSTKDYCPSGSDLVKYCTPRLAAGSDCTNFTTACPTYQSCLASPTMEGSKTCQSTPMYWIPSGQKSNGTSVAIYDSLCYDGLRDTTTGNCISNTDATAAFSSKSGIACEATTDCSSYGSCQCTSTTASACTSLVTGYTHATLTAAYTARIAKQKAYYDAGCESYTTSYSGAKPTTSNSAYCWVQQGDFASIYTACGAMHNMALSSVTLVLSALFATFFAKW